MTTGGRWLRFTLVGLAGFALQLTMVWLLARVTALPVSAIVAVAVLLTVSHNFLWHERVTWPGHARRGRGRRWLAFQATNGTISIATNVIVTGPVMAMTGLPIQAANAIAVAVAACANFLAGDRLVFRRPQPQRASASLRAPSRMSIVCAIWLARLIAAVPSKGYRP